MPGTITLNGEFKTRTDRRGLHVCILDTWHCIPFCTGTSPNDSSCAETGTKNDSSDAEPATDDGDSARSEDDLDSGDEINFSALALGVAKAVSAEIRIDEKLIAFQVDDLVSSLFQNNPLAFLVLWPMIFVKDGPFERLLKIILNEDADSVERLSDIIIAEVLPEELQRIETEEIGLDVDLVELYEDAETVLDIGAKLKRIDSTTFLSLAQEEYLLVRDFSAGALVAYREAFDSLLEESQFVRVAQRLVDLVAEASLETDIEFIESLQSSIVADLESYFSGENIVLLASLWPLLLIPSSRAFVFRDVPEPAVLVERAVNEVLVDVIRYIVRSSEDLRTESLEDAVQQLLPDPALYAADILVEDTILPYLNILEETREVLNPANYLEDIAAKLSDIIEYAGGL